MRPVTVVNILFASTLLVVSAAIYYFSIHWVWLLVTVFFFLSIHTVGVMRIQKNYFLHSLSKGSGAKKILALTFDDGPVANTSAILDVLKEHEVPATFFCIGKNITGNESVLKRIDEEGHLIGNHSYDHGFFFDLLTSNVMVKDIKRSAEAIAGVIGKEPLLFRPPYGITNPNLSRAVKKSKVISIGWSVRSYDTTIKDKQKIKARVIDKLQNGDVILLHDFVDVTTEILTDIITEAKEKGFTFVRIDEMFDINAYQ